MLKNYTIKNIKPIAIGCAKIQKYANKKIKNDLFSFFTLFCQDVKLSAGKQKRHFTAKK